jgi:lipoprotein signal peptidase
VKTGRHVLAGGLIALAVLAIDQLSKYGVLELLALPLRGSVEILPFLNLTMVWNQGVTFGLFSSNRDEAALALGAVALAVVVGLAIWLWRAEKRTVALALGAICGGAVGNVIDRLRFGAVVDFLHAHAFGYSWYVFNVADAAIVCGVAVLVLDSLRPATP